MDIISHLFRNEYRKIVAVLCRRFGFDQIEVAEDMASDTFLTAAQSWGVEGIPPNPVAWLYAVAKNKAHNYLRHQSVFQQKIIPALSTTPVFTEIDLSPDNILDSQLLMIFAVCHPAIPEESQAGLSLRILCGFGVEEIADAFLTNKETINKRLFRAKEKLRESGIQAELPAAELMRERLDGVLKTIYLLFNEGYYSVSRNRTLRRDLCLEAMRLCTLLVENDATNRPEVNALLALMCFHASRFDARFDAGGAIILYEEQDTDLWNTDLISKGGYFLQQSGNGDYLSKYHLEASIAWWHTKKADTAEKWERILQLYNHLLQLEYSPVAALNRTYALAKVYGKQKAIGEAEKLDLKDNHLYYALLGELYSGLEDQIARQNFLKAIALARTEAEKEVLRKKLSA